MSPWFFLTALLVSTALHFFGHLYWDYLCKLRANRRKQQVMEIAEAVIAGLAHAFPKGVDLELTWTISGDTKDDTVVHTFMKPHTENFEEDSKEDMDEDCPSFDEATVEEYRRVTEEIAARSYRILTDTFRIAKARNRAIDLCMIAEHSTSQPLYMPPLVENGEEILVCLCYLHLQHLAYLTAHPRNHGGRETLFKMFNNIRLLPEKTELTQQMCDYFKKMEKVSNEC